MVVTGFEVYGAFAATVGLLNFARQGVEYIIEITKAFKSIESDVTDAQTRCSSIFVEIELWYQYWNFHMKTPDSEYEKHWADEWRTIKNQIGVSVSLCFHNV